MPLNKGYLTAKTDKASDEVFTPEYAVKPLLKYIALYAQKHNFNQNNPHLGFDKRINYYKDEAMTKTQDGVSFGSCYLCKNFLPKDLIIEELNR